VRDRKRDEAREAREREAHVQFRATQADHTGDGAAGDGWGVGGQQKGGEAQRGHSSAESEVSSQAADATPSVPVSNEILRGEAGRRHRRAPAIAVVARSDVSSDADSDTKNRALEEADEMMQMFAPPKRSTQVRGREGTAVREYVCVRACRLL
jgi:hypothetical protein